VFAALKSVAGLKLLLNAAEVFLGLQSVQEVYPSEIDIST
jgi:hypothetical protein